MLKYNGHILKVGSGTIKYTFTPPTYTVTCTATHGSVTATPSQGISGTLITLSNTPDSGYEFDYYTVNGITLVGNTFTLTEDVTVECVFKEIVVTYDYFTFKAKDTGTYKCDQAYMCAKKYNNGSYLKDLDTGTEYSINGNDAMSWTLTAGHTYELCWTDADITATRNYNPTAYDSASYPCIYSDSSNNPPRHLAEVYSIDFWHKPYWSNFNMFNVTVIPQSAANIHRSAELISCARLFYNAPLTCNIEPFILAMQQVCPNLTTTSGCFSGCTSAPDYAYCLATYPNWF